MFIALSTLNSFSAGGSFVDTVWMGSLPGKIFQ